MKKLSLLAMLACGLIISSCDKDDDPPANTNKVTNVRYELTTTTVGDYLIEYTVDTTLSYDSALNTTNWSRTAQVTRPQNASGDSAVLTVIPPEAWIGTTTNTLATLRIFVNDAEKVKDTATIGGFDRPARFTVRTTF